MGVCEMSWQFFHAQLCSATVAIAGFFCILPFSLPMYGVKVVFWLFIRQPRDVPILFSLTLSCSQIKKTDIKVQSLLAFGLLLAKTVDSSARACRTALHCK